MRILSLTIKNFLSHKDTTIHLDNLGVVLIDGENRDRGGSNGAGKTSLIEALYWCFYGQLLREIKVSDLSYKGKGNVDVSAHVLLDDGGNCVIRRTHTFRGEQPLTLTLNGTNVEAGTIVETQKKINSLLRMDAKTFKHVVLFSAHSESFASLTDRGQKEILDSILGLDRLPKAYEKASDKLKEFRILRGSVDQLVTTTAYSVEQGRVQVAHLEASERGFQNTKQLAIKKAKSDLTSLLGSQPKVDPETPQKLETLRKRLADIRKVVDPVITHDLLTRLMVAQTEVTKTDLSLQTVRESVAGALDLLDVDAALKASSECPACKQKLPKPALANLRKSYEKQRKDQEFEQEHLLSRIRALESIRKDQKELHQKLSEEYSKVQGQDQERQKLELEAVRLDGSIKSVEREMEVWNQRVQQADRALSNAEAMTSPFGLLLDVERTRLNEAIQTLELAQKEQAKRDEEQSYLEFWKQGFSNQGVKGLLLDNVTPYLNEKANEYAKILTGGTAQIEFVTHYRNEHDELKEKFDVSAAYNYGASTYDGVSDGERRRLDLACLFALGDLAQARTGSTIQLRLLDEPFGPLDAVGQEQVLKLLNVLAGRLGTVLITCHEDGIRALVEKRITVVKEYGVSRVAA